MNDKARTNGTNLKEYCASESFKIKFINKIMNKMVEKNIDLKKLMKALSFSKEDANRIFCDLNFSIDEMIKMALYVGLNIRLRFDQIKENKQ